MFRIQSQYYEGDAKCDSISENGIDRYATERSEGALQQKKIDDKGGQDDEK